MGSGWLKNGGGGCCGLEWLGQNSGDVGCGWEWFAQNSI